MVSRKLQKPLRMIFKRLLEERKNASATAMTPTALEALGWVVLGIQM